MLGDLRRVLAAGQRQPAPDLRPGKHPAQRLRGLRDRLRDHGGARLSGSRSARPNSELDVVQAQLPDRGTLEVVTLLASLDQQQRTPGPQHRDREAREPGSGAQIDEARDGRQVRGERRRIQDQAAHDRLDVAVPAQVDALTPALEQSRRGAAAPRSARLARQRELGEAGQQPRRAGLDSGSLGLRALRLAARWLLARGRPAFGGRPRST